MKAVLALIVIYVGAFLLAIQGSSPVSVEAAQSAATNENATAKPAPIDPTKEVDIRALLELVGARDQVQESVKFATEQYREKLLASVPNTDGGHAFVNTVISDYQKNFDVDQVSEQLVFVYDKHYSDDEIKGLLQFYGSPLGQKVAAEAPKISREIQETSRIAAAKAAKEALQQAKDDPNLQNSHLGSAAARRFQQRHSQDPPAQQTAQQDQP